MSRVSDARQGDYFEAIERLFQDGTTSGLSEAQLLERFAVRRDGASFAALVERHGPMVLGVCRRFLRDPNDVDDAFQAVFLVLVRRAGDIRRKELLGNWLYGVACRVAARARSMAARRPAATLSEADGDRIAVDLRRPSSRGPDEGGSWLHEEVERLPRRYRAPVVACYFEGRTHEEAAALLGCPLGTVKGRLSRARDLLRKRLERRGLAVPAVALASQLSAADLRAAVPPTLAQTTVRSGLALTSAASTVMTTSAISLPVRTLTQGVLHAMVVTQIKAAAIPTLLVAAGVLTAGARVAARQNADGKPQPAQAAVAAPNPKVEAPPEKPAEAATKPEAAKISDGDYLAHVEDWGRSYGALMSQHRSDLNGGRSGANEEKARTVYRARIDSMIRTIEKEEPASQAGHDMKAAFLHFLNIMRDTAGESQTPGLIDPSKEFNAFGFRDILQEYIQSISRLRTDLRSMQSDEEKAAAQDLHRARLDGIIKSFGMNNPPLEELCRAYIGFRDAIAADRRAASAAKVADARAQESGDDGAAPAAETNSKPDPVKSSSAANAPRPATPSQDPPRSNAASNPGSSGAAEAETLPPQDLTTFQQLIPIWRGEFQKLRLRLERDLLRLKTEEEKRNALAVYNDQVETMLAKLEEQGFVSDAERELKAAFMKLVQGIAKDDQTGIEAMRNHESDLQAFNRLQTASSIYERSASTLRSDLDQLKSSESRKAARALHRSRLAAMAPMLKPDTYEQPFRDFALAFSTYLQKVESNPERPAVVATTEAPKAKPEQPAESASPPQASNAKASRGGANAGGGLEGGGMGGPTDGERRQDIERVSAYLRGFDQSPRTQAVLKALDEPMTLRFAQETPFAKVLDQIREKAKGADGELIPIYVDPQGLRDAEATLQSGVSIDLANVPLKFSLRLILKQIRLAYCVRDGVVIISSLEGVEQELMEAESEQIGLRPELFPTGYTGINSRGKHDGREIRKVGAGTKPPSPG